MSEQLAPTTAGTLAAGENTLDTLFADFLRWLDRPEKTAYTYTVNIRQFLAWTRYMNRPSPTREDVMDYRDWLEREHDAVQLSKDGGWEYRTDRSGNRVRVSCKPTTVSQYLRSISLFFRWAASRGLYPQDITKDVRAPKVSHDIHRKDALEPAEVLDIERSIVAKAEAKTTAAEGAAKDREGRTQRSTEQGKRLYAMYLLAVTAGLRTVEISRANVRDLETKGGTTWLYIWGKGHSEPDQKKPLAPEVAAAIRDYLESRADAPTGSSPLFVGTGNRNRGRITTNTIGIMLKRAMQDAGYNSERLTAHSLRHTAGTAVQELTGNLYTTQKYMRHSNPATTEIYLHNQTEKQEAEIAKQLYNLYHQEGEKPAEAG